LLLHTGIAALPWLTRCPTPLAIVLSALAVIGFVGNIGRVPGRHCRLQAVAVDQAGWRVQLAGETAWRAATLEPVSRALAAGVLLELRSGGGRRGWLLPRQALPPASFRRLRARIRLTC